MLTRMRKKPRDGASERTIAGGWVIGRNPGDVPASAERQQPAENDAPITDDNADHAPERDQYDNFTIVLFGVFGGLYLLYSWWWVIVARAYSTINAATADGSGLVGGILQQIIFWVTPFAPLTWFLAAMLIARGKKPWVLGVALLIGAIVLVPLPMITGGGAS